MGRSRISVSISDGLRTALASACERSGRSLTAEVEARLRHALGTGASDGLLLLRLDDGLWAWLRAHVEGVGIFGGMEATAIFMIRSGLIEAHKSDVFVRSMFPHLPPSIQDAICGRSALKGIERAPRRKT